MKTVLITGANRGLGLEFCRQYQAQGWEVVATCRDPDHAILLRELGLEIVALDVSDLCSIAALAGHLKGRVIDLLVNNAGIMGDANKSALTADSQQWQQAFAINVMGPALVTNALLENLGLSESPVAVTMGSQAGIFNKMSDATLAIYRSTKAAAHAVTISLGYALSRKHIIYLSLRPGRTVTDMTGDSGIYSAAESVQLMCGVLKNVTLADAGKFIDRSGKIYSYQGDFEE